MGRCRATRTRERFPWRRATACLSALITASTAVAGLAITQAAHAAYIGSEGRIAFVRNGSIYSILPSGKGLRLLAKGGHDAGPRWSPDGRQLAYLNRGNLWIMNANGSHKHQITSGAPRFTDGRPSWSPSGRYLAFVKTARHHQHGFLTRYDTVTGHFRAFTTTISPPGLIRVAARRGTAVAWQLARDNSSFGYFIIYEGAGLLCSAGHYCLNALGLGTEGQVSNGFPSAEDITAAPVRLTDPDWYPIRPEFDTQVLTSVESCTATGCTHTGIRLQITSATILPGAYQAVYSPIGAHIAFVRNGRRGPRIYTEGTSPAVAEMPQLLTSGTQPDWQPVAPFPPA